MARMSNKRRLEWSFFLNDRSRITYNELCRKCQHVGRFLLLFYVIIKEKKGVIILITYGYRIKLENGPVIRKEDRKPFTDCLQFMVNTELGSDIGTDSTMRFLVESAVPGYDKNGRITDVTIHADMPMSEEFYDRAGEMIADATDQAWYQISKDMSIEITAQGDLQVLGMEGDMPAKLYHITDRAGADSILKEGLRPKQGENSYRNDEDFVYLTDMEQLPVWMGILKDPDDMVLLEVDPAGVRNMERGRTNRNSHRRTLYERYEFSG